MLHLLRSVGTHQLDVGAQGADERHGVSGRRVLAQLCQPLHSLGGAEARIRQPNHVGLVLGEILPCLQLGDGRPQHDAVLLRLRVELL